ncbi:MAG TPA: carbohydrate ABC transporter permease [Anaerolineales bacterium]|nr:carbohydrate ABC transporter permease [Anaerolineales bacterium]
MTATTETRTPTRETYSVSHRLVRFIQRTPVHIAILIIVAIWMEPTIALLVSSFRPASAVANTGWWTAFQTPFQFTLELYRQALAGSGMAQSFVNSLFISIPATVIPIMVAAFAAFAFAWMEFRGRDLLFVIVVGLLVVPLQSTLIPVLRLYTRLNLTGTFPGIWLAHTGYGLPFAVYLLRNFFGTLPREMMESAYLDGASPFTAFFRLVLPLSVPALASLAIFQFMWVWNDLLVALIYLGGFPSVAPMTVTISNLVNSLGSGWQLLTAAAFISMALPLFIFFALQRYFVRGILAGSVKG